MAIFTVFRFLVIGLVITCFFPWTGYAQVMGVKGLQYGSPDSFAEFHGFISLEFMDFQKDGPSGNEVGAPGTSTFDLHNFYFNAIAKVRQNVTIFGEVEYEHGGGEINLDRAFIDWGLAEDYLSVRLGKFYSPFGLDLRDYQAPTRKLVSRPLMADALLFNEWTEVGINAYGQIKPRPVGFTYDIALVNGPGDVDKNGMPLLASDLLSEQSRQNRDNNSSKDIVGRISVPVDLGAGTVELGGSWGGGRYSSKGAPENLDFSLTGVDAEFRMAGVLLRSEYVKRKADFPGNVTVNSKSYYVQASYRVGFNQNGLNYLEPVVRYDSLDPDTGISKNEMTETSFGLNYSPYAHMVIRSEYQFNSEKQTPHLKNNGYLLQAVVDF
ncbi:MAG: hypothetical protein HY283_06400 [Nitrospirae bacterium]|nr:hypothetical protein [Nitrospirota bacterium]